VSLSPLRRWEQRLGALPLPSPLIWALLAVAFLGFGVLLGRATLTPAARRAPLKLLLAKAPAPSAPAAPPATPPPLPEAENTPLPEPATPSTSPPAKETGAHGTSPSGSSEGSQGSNEKRGGEGRSSPSATKLPPIEHVFVVMLADEPYATAFGPASPARYLTGTLEKQGKLLVRYYAVAHEGLADGIALLSGQGPTTATAADCPTYTPLSQTGTAPHGQVTGEGCVYPSAAPTLMGQLAAKHLTWKGYIEGLGERGTGACAHPAPGAPDPSASGQAPAATGYQTQRNPFVYFQAIVASPACASHDLGVDGLDGDLASEARTPSLSYIAPGPCDDGSPTACAPGKTSGMMAADGFLRKIVPKILSSKAYKKNGLLVITIDQAPAGGEYADSSSCCGQPRFPNLAAPTGAAALSPPGGGQVGLLLLSPFVKGSGLVQDTYNHFSLLATIEQIFGLSRLGYAGLPEVKPLSPSLFSGG
jgi:phosphatidylinositol-3-phosphatase